MRQRILVMVATAALSLGCSEEENSLYTSATAAIVGKGENAALKGTAKVVEDPKGVKITVSLTGAPAGEKLGVHIHAMGSCDDNDAGAAGAAGGHFNPELAMHGALNKGHAGDLGNITIDDDGKGTMTVVSTVLKLGENAYSVNNKAIVVHEATDDLKTDPSGMSGARIGCGVLR